MWMEQQDKEEGWSGKRKGTTVGQRLDALKGVLRAKKVQLPPVTQEGNWPQVVVEPHGVFVPCCPKHRQIWTHRQRTNLVDQSTWMNGKTGMICWNAGDRGSMNRLKRTNKKG